MIFSHGRSRNVDGNPESSKVKFSVVVLFDLKRHHYQIFFLRDEVLLGRLY
jgi:hypothetical protein